MQAKWWVAAAVAVVALGVGAQGALAAPKPEAVLSAEDTVAARQASFMLSGAAMGAIKAAVEAKADPKSMQFTARALNRWAKQLPAMFPEGTALEGSGAKPEVWSDRAAFEAAAAEYVAATDGLVSASASGDYAIFAERWAAVGRACKACHDRFRAERR